MDIYGYIYCYYNNHNRSNTNIRIFYVADDGSKADYDVLVSKGARLQRNAVLDIS